MVGIGYQHSLKNTASLFYPNQAWILVLDTPFGWVYFLYNLQL